MNQDKTPGQQLLMLVAISLCCMFIGQVLGQIMVLLYYGDQWRQVETYEPMLVLTVAGITHLFTHIAVFFIFLRVSGLSFGAFFPERRLKLIYLILVPLVALACIFLAAFLTNLSAQFFEENGFLEIVQAELARQAQLLPLLVHNNVGQLILSLFVFTILPAVGEEFIYRGILQTRLAEATKNVHFSVIISAAIFAAMHWQPVNLLAIAALGLVLGYVYAYTKNIWYGVILHFLINAIQILQLYFWPELTS